MQFINCSSLTSDVSNWLATSGHPRILHIFDRACNLINERGDVLSIVTPKIGNGPFNLVVADDICFLDHWNLDSPIYYSPSQFNIGNLTIYLSEAKLWNPRPDWEVLHARKCDISNELTQLPIANYLNIGGLDRQGLPSSQSLLSRLSSALANEDVSAAKTITSQLAGLGSGLTPAGDDFLMGALYAAWIIHPCEVARVLAQEIADTAVPLTTSLSAAWLKSAGKGEAATLWHEFFDALVSGSPTPAPNRRCGVGDSTYLSEAVENILSIGETSGADALAGFICVFASWIEKSGSHE